MFDHERSLVQKMSGKPFALIGVNVDDELEDVRMAVKDKELNWRSFFEGDSKKVTGQYAIQSFPTVFLLDQNGVIRHKFEGGPDPDELDRKIEQMVGQVR